jgi:hypothetical protein
MGLPAQEVGESPTGSGGGIQPQASRSDARIAARRSQMKRRRVTREDEVTLCDEQIMAEAPNGDSQGDNQKAPATLGAFWIIR